MEEIKEREPAELKLDLTHADQALKNIPRKLISKFIIEQVTAICGKSKNDFNQMSKNGSQVISIYAKSEKDAENILEDLNKATAFNFGDFIERETNVSRKKYNRNIIFFESAIENSTLTLTWK